MIRTEIYVPLEFREPDAYAYKTKHADWLGTYECESNLFVCITHHDRAILELNVENMIEAHKRVIRLIDNHNKEVERSFMENPHEIKCGAFDFKCRKRKNKLLGQ